MGGSEKDRYIFIEQIGLLNKNYPALIWVNLLTATLILLLLLGNVPTVMPVAWFAVMLVYFALRIWYHNRIKNEIITVDNVYSHGASFVVFSFLAGAIWGSLGIFLPIYLNPYILVLTAILLCGMVAGSTLYLSTYKDAYIFFALPCVVPFALRCLFSHQSSLFAIGVILLLFLVVSLFNSHLAQRNILKAIQLELENKELIEKLRDEKIYADEARHIADHNNKAKSRFLAAASHDLRQPLHAMGFFVEALTYEKDPAQISSLVSKTSQTLEALRNLLGSLMDISKIEAGVMEPRKINFILNDIFVEIIQEFEEIAGEKGLELRFKSCFQTVYSDKEMLGRIIRNLVSNAVRYTEIGYVELSWEKDNNGIIISVSDSGNGIAGKHQKNIFREFFQIEEGEDDAPRGIGLGLSIVDGLIRLLEYELHLTSKMGIGSVFSVKIPLGETTAINSNISDSNIWSGDKVARIMILNNDDISREGIAEIMRYWGHIVFDFKSFEEAMTFLAKQKFIPNIVIADSKLSDSPGMEALKSIQKKIGLKIPAIIMTGVGGANLDHIKDSEFSILYKPVQPAKLRSMIHYLIK